MAAGAPAWLGYRYGEADAATQPPAPPARIEALRANPGASRALIAEIDAEFALQVAAAERIQAEAQENERLAALRRDEAEAVRQFVERTIEGAQARSAKLGSRQQWLFFLAGLPVSVPLGVVGNVAFEAVKGWLGT